MFVKDTGVSSAFYAKFIMNFDGHGANDHDRVYDILTYERRMKWESAGDAELPEPIIVEKANNELLAYEKKKKPPAITFMS